jgi:acyl-CoA thioester hydrolase
VHEKRIDIRWRDQDAYQHVNQAVYMTYLEEILDDWIRHVLGLPEGEAWNYFAARVAIDYRDELQLADRQVVGSAGLVRVGTKSVTARIEMRAPDGRLVAEAETVIVARDPETRGSKALSDEERIAFEACR